MLNVYRAATQSLAGDEALTFHWFLRDAGWRDLFTRYNANHHVLHSLLAKASISLLGNSEFALRVPTLAERRTPQMSAQHGKIAARCII